MGGATVTCVIPLEESREEDRDVNGRARQGDDC